MRQKKTAEKPRRNTNGWPKVMPPEVVARLAANAGVAPPDDVTRDREGRPILAGALIVEHPGGIPHPSFGRVIAAAGQVLLMRTFAGNELFGDDVDGGTIMYA